MHQGVPLPRVCCTVVHAGEPAYCDPRQAACKFRRNPTADAAGCPGPTWHVPRGVFGAMPQPILSGDPMKSSLRGGSSWPAWPLPPASWRRGAAAEAPRPVALTRRWLGRRPGNPVRRIPTFVPQVTAWPDDGQRRSKWTLAPPSALSKSYPSPPSADGRLPAPMNGSCPAS